MADPQPIAALPLIAAGTSLRVMEAFYTIQGEGAFSGHAAYFIRLGGCDVGCTWCDVKESWSMDAHPTRTVEDLVTEASAYPARLAVITGGEPLMQDLGPLTAALRAAGFRTHIETSGTHPLSGKWHHITFSPKKFKAPLDAIYAKARELKVIVFNRHDLVWAQEHAVKANPHCQLFLQPEWEKRDLVMPMLVDFVKDHPEWKISLQTHKYLDIP